MAVHHSAGTNGGADAARAYFEHGVDTVLYIHATGRDSAELEDEFGEEKTLIVTGHIAGDAVGRNARIDDLEAHGFGALASPVPGSVDDAGRPRTIRRTRGGSL